MFYTLILFSSASASILGMGYQTPGFPGEEAVLKATHHHTRETLWKTLANTNPTKRKETQGVAQESILAQTTTPIEAVASESFLFSNQSSYSSLSILLSHGKNQRRR